MAAGRLSSDNEMLAVMAAGIPPRRVFMPFLVLGLAFSLVSFAMNDYFLPRGSIEFGKALAQARSRRRPRSSSGLGPQSDIKI